VQFAIARSHVYAILTFWDPDENRAAELVIDPGLQRESFFAVELVRDLLNGPEALLFEAPLLAHFRLDQGRLTARQQSELESLLESHPELKDWQEDLQSHAALVRTLSGAAPGSMGDPDCWTYA